MILFGVDFEMENGEETYFAVLLAKKDKTVQSHEKLPKVLKLRRIDLLEASSRSWNCFLLSKKITRLNTES